MTLHIREGLQLNYQENTTSFKFMRNLVSAAQFLLEKILKLLEGGITNIVKQTKETAQIFTNNRENHSTDNSLNVRSFPPEFFRSPVASIAPAAAISRVCSAAPQVHPH